MGLAEYAKMFEKEPAVSSSKSNGKKAASPASDDSAIENVNVKVSMIDSTDADEEGDGQYAAPLVPARSVDELLKDPIQWIEWKGAAAEALAITSKYEPCNVGPAVARTSIASTPLTERGNETSPHQPVASTSKETLDAPLKPASPLAPIPMRWPTSRKRHVGAGLQNVGNTCYANSAIQALVHTAPLATLLLESGFHERRECRAGYCVLCAMTETAWSSLCKQDRFAFTPGAIVNNLRKLASHFRLGRQEDSHELLRFIVDGMQTAALRTRGIAPKTAKPEQRRQTPIYRIFGGKFRSRVTCHSCGHNSDTYDDFFDLSLDINRNTSSVRQALDNLKRVDYLRGKNKYKCEKCKREVDAEKQLTVETAPLILTLHLKRFGPLGGKITSDIEYKEHLLLNVMSDDEEPPSYKLHGVICHSGGGPNSGHYYAFVRDAHDRWHRADDSSVTACGGREWMSRSAYILLYTRTNEGSSMLKAVNEGVKANGTLLPSMKRKASSLADDESPTKKVFIGPVKPETKLDALRTALPTTSSSPNKLRTSPGNDDGGFKKPFGRHASPPRNQYRDPTGLMRPQPHRNNAQYGHKGRRGGAVAVGPFYGRGRGGRGHHHHGGRGRGHRNW